MTKPMTAPMTCGHGPAPDSPCKCTPQSPAACLTTPSPRCDFDEVVKQSLGMEHQQGESGAGIQCSESWYPSDNKDQEEAATTETTAVSTDLVFEDVRRISVIVGAIGTGAACYCCFGACGQGQGRR